ncbi:MAG: CPBP family intramembrane metalloprotease/isoprenylcysteine carboxylmethyltransferase [Treponematales bacterium]
MLKTSINGKLFFILLAVSIVGVLLVMPYQLAMLPEPVALTPMLVLAAVIQNLVLFGIAIFFGLLLSKRVGMGLPILEGALEGKPRRGALVSALPLSVGVGAAGGVIVVLLDLLFRKLPITTLLSADTPIWWKGLLASFYGGIAEELLCRLFLVSLFVWLTTKIKKTAAGAPTNFGVWFSIVLAAVLFGLGHLPATAAVTALTPLIVARAVLLNGVLGVAFGFLYWKKGLESAMIAHFSADIVLHVIATAAALFNSMSVQYYLSVALFALFIACVLGRAATLRRRGIRAIVFGTTDKTDFILVPIMLALVYSVCTAVFPLPLWKPLVVPFWETALPGWAGIALCALSVAGIIASLVSFGNSFRVGIDAQKPDKLVTTGMFAFSRNPIYVCFDAFFIGQFLVHHNTALLLFAALFALLIHRQILREEKFLKVHYGAEYAAYCQKTRRYL